jgi:hypothetical protein
LLSSLSSSSPASGSSSPDDYPDEFVKMKIRTSRFSLPGCPIWEDSFTVLPQYTDKKEKRIFLIYKEI